MLICNKAWGCDTCGCLSNISLVDFFDCWSICLYRISVGKCQVYTLATLGVWDRDVDA